MGRQQRGGEASAVHAPVAPPDPPVLTPPGSCAGVLAATMFLAPALGVPGEHMLQDTFKSIVVAFGTLAAAGLLFWGVRRGHGVLHWHGVLWLPLLLAAYALGSMAWSHAYLAGVEAVRWTVFALLLWVGLNGLARERLPWLALGIHAGAVVASLWAVLQFWTGFSPFPQGPNPASTFINRNFFAEFAVCTLPFSALLLARARDRAAVLVLAGGCALTMLAVLMTGTRSALVTLWVLLFAVLPLAAWRCRAQLALRDWDRGTRILAVAVLLGGVVGLGLLPSVNDRILLEGRGATALERGLGRTASISPSDGSVGLRLAMWRSTVRMIEDRPVAGVGAGAWEVHMLRYQPPGTELETDFYVHNEVLQLLAEYGLVGVAFLLGLTAYLLHAAWRTWRGTGPLAEAERPWRAAALASLLALLLVGNAGFPWRMATTGALFAVALAVLAASDVRLRMQGPWAATPIGWRPAWSMAALAGTAAATALAVHITVQAAECERKIVEAARLALMISAAPDPGSPRWDVPKARVLELAREAIAINPHYRKITPEVADAMAGWGDWKNAVWIWESVLESRPYVVAILTNVARGYTQLGQPQKAAEYIDRARRISPEAPSLLSLDVILLARAGQERQAAELARSAIDRGRYDADLLRHAVRLGWRTGDSALLERSATLLAGHSAATRLEGWRELADFYWRVRKDEALALQAWRQALDAAAPLVRPQVLAQVPPALRAKL